MAKRKKIMHERNGCKTKVRLVEEFLENHDRPFSSRDIASELGMTHLGVSGITTSLKKQNRILVQGAGKSSMYYSKKLKSCSSVLNNGKEAIVELLEMWISDNGNENRSISTVELYDELACIANKQKVCFNIKSNLALGKKLSFLHADQTDLNIKIWKRQAVGSYVYTFEMDIKDKDSKETEQIKEVKSESVSKSKYGILFNKKLVFESDNTDLLIKEANKLQNVLEFVNFC